jgi:hypothetical protein
MDLEGLLDLLDLLLPSHPSLLLRRPDPVGRLHPLDPEDLEHRLRLPDQLRLLRLRFLEGP